MPNVGNLYGFVDPNASTQLYAWSTPYNTSKLSTLYTTDTTAVTGETCITPIWTAATTYAGHTYSTITDRSDTSRDYLWLDENLTVNSNRVWTDIWSDGASSWVVISQDRYISTSTDGSHWSVPTQISTTNTDNFVSIKYNSNTSIWYILTNNGKILSSTDLSTWTVTNNDLGSHQWFSMAFGYNRTVKFAAMGRDGSIAYSTDGSTWTVLANQLGSSYSWSGFGFGGGYYIAVASNTSNTSIYTSRSSDGSTWTTVAESQNVGSHVYTIIYGATQSYTLTATDGYRVRSTNATSWNTMARNPMMTNENWIASRSQSTNLNITVYLSSMGYILYAGGSNSTYKNYTFNLICDSTEKMYYIRDTSKDMVAPTKVFTRSETLTLNDSLYDNTGTQIAAIQSISSGNIEIFDSSIDSNLVNFTFSLTSEVTQFMLNGISYTSGATVRLAVGSVLSCILYPATYASNKYFAIDSYAISDADSYTAEMTVYADGVSFTATTTHHGFHKFGLNVTIDYTDTIR